MAKFFLILVNEMWGENFFNKYNDNGPVINNDGSAHVFIIQLKNPFFTIEIPKTLFKYVGNSVTIK